MADLSATAEAPGSSATYVPQLEVRQKPRAFARQKRDVHRDLLLHRCVWAGCRGDGSASTAVRLSAWRVPCGTASRGMRRMACPQTRSAHHDGRARHPGAGERTLPTSGMFDEALREIRATTSARHLLSRDQATLRFEPTRRANQASRSMNRVRRPAARRAFFSSRRAPLCCSANVLPRSSSRRFRD